MPDLSKYNIDFRPKTYWDLRDVLTLIEAKIAGKLRKDFIKKTLQDGGSVPGELLKGSLSDNLRDFLGSIHPSFMGGEYLSELEETDVIIATITLKSVLLDVFVIVARLTDKGIEYRVEDEYGDFSLPYKIQPQFSKEPLSFKELIDLIDNALEGGLVARDDSYGGYEPEKYYDFGTAVSGFYPQLKGWYDDINEEWLEEKKEECRQREIEKAKEETEKEIERERILKERSKVDQERSKVDQLEADKLQISIEEYKNLFHEKVAKILLDSDWSGKKEPVGSMWTHIRKGSKQGAIKNYIKDYFYANRRFPTGKHNIKTNTMGTESSLEVEFKIKNKRELTY